MRAALARTAAGLRRVDAGVAAIESGLLALLLGGLVLGGSWQVVARNFHFGTAVWVETLLRYQVMWIGLIGASLATRYRKHVTIEAIGIYLPRRAQRPMHALLGLFAAGLAGLLAWASGLMVVEEARGGRALFTIAALGLPIRSWVAQSVLPAAFAVVAARFLAQALAVALGVSAPVHETGGLAGEGAAGLGALVESGDVPLEPGCGAPVPAAAPAAPAAPAGPGAPPPGGGA
ncbi:MAG: TRAP transporter small permease [Planctomycetes bacterium]|nr:TRAP transporter small permease [Planctomycetota bacterium]